MELKMTYPAIKQEKVIGSFREGQPTTFLFIHNNSGKPAALAVSTRE